MAKKRGGLGRGLGALFGDSLVDLEPVSTVEPEKGPEKETPESLPEEKFAEGVAKKSGEAFPLAAKEDNKAASGEEIIYINLSDIKPNSKQPRKAFDEKSLADLASSIEEHGVIQPVIVRPFGKVYELVAGERRWRAARKAGLKAIPAIVRDLDERRNMFYALIENMQREDLNAIEEASGIREMIENFGLSQEEAAKVIGRSRPYVANSLRLLGLPKSVQELVSQKKLSAGHARAIAGIEGEELRISAAKKAAEEGWPVRKLEDYVGKLSKKKSEKKPSKRSAEFSAAEENLSKTLGTKVKINGNEKKGKIELRYYSREELERLLEILTSGQI